MSRLCSTSEGLPTVLVAFRYLYFPTCTAVCVHTHTYYTQALMLSTFEIVNLFYWYVSFNVNTIEYLPDTCCQSYAIVVTKVVWPEAMFIRKDGNGDGSR